QAAAVGGRLLARVVGQNSLIKYLLAAVAPAPGVGLRQLGHVISRAEEARVA
nr:hypothetical protein [Tanacetum cinerariifolium]